MAALPEVVKIGPYEYAIRDDEESWKQLQLEEQVKDDENWGYLRQRTSEIFVNPHVTSIHMKRVIVVHEVMHGIVFVAGEFFNRKRTVEFIILHTAPLWLAVLQDNPQLVDFLIGDESDGEA